MYKFKSYAIVYLFIRFLGHESHNNSLGVFDINLTNFTVNKFKTSYTFLIF